MEKPTQKTVDTRLSLLRIKLLERYLGSKHRHRFKCLTCKHIWKTVGLSCGCPKCSHERLGNLSRLSLAKVRLRLRKRNIKLLDHYRNAKDKHRFQCSLGHVWSATADSVFRGSGCPYCDNQRISKERMREIKDILKENGIRLLETYKV